MTSTGVLARQCCHRTFLEWVCPSPLSLSYLVQHWLLFSSSPQLLVINTYYVRPVYIHNSLQAFVDEHQCILSVVLSEISHGI